MDVVHKYWRKWKIKKAISSVEKVAMEKSLIEVEIRTQRQKRERTNQIQLILLWFVDWSCFFLKSHLAQIFIH